MAELPTTTPVSTLAPGLTYCGGRHSCKIEMEHHSFQSLLSLVRFFSDAAGTFGCGAFTSTHQWFQITWPEDWQLIHSKAKELLPIAVAAAIWGSRWSRQRIRFRCDNMAVVELLKSRTSQDQLLMHFLRCLSFYAACFRCQNLQGVLLGSVMC